jgi:hypothetical protein
VEPVCADHEVAVEPLGFPLMQERDERTVAVDLVQSEQTGNQDSGNSLSNTVRMDLERRPSGERIP